MFLRVSQRKVVSAPYFNPTQLHATNSASEKNEINKEEKNISTPIEKKYNRDNTQTKLVG